MSQYHILEPGRSAETLERPRAIMIGIKASNQDTGKNMKDPQEQRAQRSAIFFK